MKVKHLFWLVSSVGLTILFYLTRTTILNFVSNIREKRSVDERQENTNHIYKNEKVPLPNRTAEAENQNVLVFHRVPKTGSEMMQELGKVSIFFS